MICSQVQGTEKKTTTLVDYLGVFYKKGIRVFNGRSSVVLASGLLVMGLIISSGCTAPGAVRLTNKPSISEPPLEKDRGDVALIVRSERPESLQKSNVCGVNFQTAFVIPANVMFIAHFEDLKSIVAHHASKKIERAGYDVVDCCPPRKEELSEKEASLKDFDKSERKKAWKSGRKKVKLDKKTRKRIKKEKEGVFVENLQTKQVSPWGNKLNTEKAEN